LRRVVDEWGKKPRVVIVAPADFHTRYDVGFYAAHQMQFQPIRALLMLHKIFAVGIEFHIRPFFGFRAAKAR